ncbi:hypothetical protein ACFXA3_42415, partial [Streptomyces sp. NPDC059456]
GARDGLDHARELAGGPGVPAAVGGDAARFHADLRGAPPRAGIQVIAGVGQPTATAVASDGDPLSRQREADGDGTVPRPAALPAQTPGDGDGDAAAGAADAGAMAARSTAEPFAGSFAVYEQHGSLQNNRAVRAVLRGLLGPGREAAGGCADPAARLGVRAPAVLPAGAPYEVTVTAPGEGLRLMAQLRPADGGRASARPLRGLGGGRYGVSFAPPQPGPYRLTVGPVTALVTSLTQRP